MFGFLNFLVYSVGIGGSLAAGFLMYDGLHSREEKRRKFLMAKRRLKAFQIQTKEAASPKYLDQILDKAGRPLGLTAFKYQMVRMGVILSLLLYYYVYPLLIHQQMVYWGIVLPMFLLFLSSPKIPFSLFSFLIKKVKEIHESHKNNEVFQLHDLLISEIYLMESRQVNTYHVLKRLYPYFEHIQPELQELLQPSNWKEDPTPALERFAEQINTPEAHMLVNILTKFDKHTNRDVAIASLESNSKLFATKQIESYRVRRKLVNNMAMIPIFSTHMLIIFNFIAVVVILTINATQQTNL